MAQEEDFTSEKRFNRDLIYPIDNVI